MQDLLTLPEQLRSPQAFGGVRVAKSLVFYVVSSVLLFVCVFLFFFIFSHGVVNLFSIYEFDSLSGIFRPSFMRQQYISLYWYYKFVLSIPLQLMHCPALAILSCPCWFIALHPFDKLWNFKYFGLEHHIREKSKVTKNTELRGKFL